MALTQAVLFEPFVSSETLTLIGFHLLAAEGEAGSSGSESPETCGDTVLKKQKRLTQRRRNVLRK